MLKKNNSFQFLGLFLSFVLISCTSQISNTLNYNKSKSINTFGFNAKSTNRIEENEPNINYVGTWNIVSDVNSSNASYSQTSGELFDDADSSFFYNNTWDSLSNSDAYNNSYKLSSSEIVIPYSSESLVYSQALSSWKNTYGRKYIESNPIAIDDKNTSIVYGGTNWNQNNFTHSSNVNGNYIEIPFSGTNINIFANRNASSGKVNITVKNTSSNIVERTINNFDLYNSEEINSDCAIKIQGLPNDNHIVKIEITDQKNSSSNDYFFKFDKALIYPSVQYKFSGTNISYSALKNIKAGKVDIILDNNLPEQLDLYSPINEFFIKTFDNLSFSEHTITIQATNEKNSDSLGNIINFEKFIIYPNLSNDIPKTNHFNLDYIKAPSYGKADLIVFDKDSQGNYTKLDTAKINGLSQNLPYEIDMYNNTDILSTLEISNLSLQKHAFTLVSKGQKNISSSGTNISFDRLFIGSKISYDFYGSEINYIASKGQNQGKLEIFIDGQSQGIYDLYSLTTESQKNIFKKGFGSNGTHNIEIRQLGQKNNLSSGININLDAFEVLVEESTISFGSIANSIARYLDILGETIVTPKTTQVLTVKAYDNAGNEIPDSASKDKWTWNINSALIGYLNYSGSDNTVNFISKGKTGSVDITACSKLTGLKKTVTVQVPDVLPYVKSVSPIGTDLILPTSTPVDTVTNVSFTTALKTFNVTFNDMNDWIITSGCTCSGGTNLKIAYQRNDTSIFANNTTTFKNVPLNQADNYDIYVGGFPSDNTTLRNNISSSSSASVVGSTEDVLVTFKFSNVSGSGFIIVNAKQVNLQGVSVVTRRHKWIIN